jgi:hypothetical protein
VKHTITVLQDDIDNGKPRSSRDCAIALAAKRELFTDILIGSTDIWIGSTGFTASNIETPAERGTLPVEALAFILRFDQGLPVEPFKFEVDLQPKLPVSYPSFSTLWGIEPYTFESFKTNHVKYTELFQPKSTAHASNEYVNDMIQSFAPGGLIIP